MKAGADLKQAGNPPPDFDPASGGLGDAAEYFQQGALAGAVAADNAEDFPLLDLEAYVLERPEFFNVIALDDLSSAHEIDGLAGKVFSFAADDIAQRNIAFALNGSVADEKGFGKVFDADNRHALSQSPRSDQIGEARFHLPELA